MIERFLGSAIAALIATPAHADDIGGITLGMNRDDARSILSAQGKVIESPTIEKGAGRGASSIQAGRYWALLCNGQVAIVSREISSDFVTFASMAHDKQDALNHASDTNVISAGGHTPLSAIYLTWTRPNKARYVLSYQKGAFYEIVMEAIAKDFDTLCLPFDVHD